MSMQERGEDTSAVVFAYHNVGVRCLAVLLAQGVRVPLVVTHEDAAGENIWFASVRDLAAAHDIPVTTPLDPNAAETLESILALRPDFLFSFYYRAMIKAPLLAVPRRGALNMHGSLLPKYRGRAPVNWAVIRGETETGASLHYMVEKPDAGAIVDQQAVPILRNDTALDVFNKVTVAAELALHRTLPRLLDGTATATQQDLAQGNYFGGRKPEDGRIDWARPAREIHNLVRGVAPPYPGAFTDVRGSRVRILRTLGVEKAARGGAPALYVDAWDNRLYADCAGGGVLRILDFEIDGVKGDAQTFANHFGPRVNPLKST
jgi:methionyl-tRNA formyltransferase